MCEQLDLRDVDAALELKDKLLREDAETLAVPTGQVARISCIVGQLAYSVPCVLARAIKNFEIQDGFDLVGRHWLVNHHLPL